MAVGASAVVLAPGLRPRHRAPDGSGLLSHRAGRPPDRASGSSPWRARPPDPGSPCRRCGSRGSWPSRRRPSGSASSCAGAGLVVALPVLVVVSARRQRPLPLGAGARARRRAHPVLRRGLPQGTRRAAAAPRAAGSAARTARGPAREPRPRDPDGVHGGEPPLLPGRRLPRHADRRPAGARPDRHHRHAAADHVHPAADLGPHHAGGHLLRLAVRRLDDLDPGQPARRGGVGGHHARRLPDGAAGAGRGRARHRRHRLVLRRHRRDVPDRRRSARRSRRWRSGSGRPSTSR